MRSSPVLSAKTTNCAVRSNPPGGECVVQLDDGSLVTALRVNAAGPGSGTTLSLRPERVEINPIATLLVLVSVMLLLALELLRRRNGRMRGIRI